MEISQEYSDYQMVLVKGKRTKRPRGLSPVHSSCSSGGEGGGGGAYCSSSAHSPATSTSQISTTNDEDEDMANCLILLARGGRHPKQVERISSRKLAEMAGGGKADLYVYQCKTCNRTFPSFQALGGHRASHKKPKITAEDQKKSPPLDHHQHHDNEADKKQSAPLSTMGITTQSNSNGKSKIHECSICGSEFSSGQALGGHMRRHRPPPTINPANPPRSSDGTTNVSESSDGREKPRGVFALDLNLPAPLEDDDQDTKLQNLAFSTPALVDCHY